MAASSKKKTSSKKKSASRKKAEPEPSRFVAVLGRLRDVTLGLVTGRELDEEAEDQVHEVIGLLLIGLSVWLGISLFSFYKPFGDPGAVGRNWGGQVGYYLAQWALILIGWSGYLLSFLGVAWGAILVSGRTVQWPILRTFGGVCFLFSTAFLFQLMFGEGFYQEHFLALEEGRASTGQNALPFGPGGWLALELIGPSPNHAIGETAPLVEKFGRPGLWILLSLIALSSFTIATERAFFPAITAFGAWLGERRSEEGEGVFRALGGFLSRMFHGWWSFLSGADLELTPVEALPEKTKKTKGGTKKADKKAKPAKKKSKKAAAEAPLPEPASEEEEDDGEWEYEDDEDGEWEDDEDGAWAEGDEEGEWEEDEEGEWEDEDDPDAEWEEEWEDVEEEEEADEEDPARVAARAAAKEKLAKSIKQSGPVLFDPPTPPPGPWKFPPLDLLEPPDPDGGGGKDTKTIQTEAERLENVLRSFRVDATVCGSTVGPSVTMYELEVASGTRMNKVTALSQEIAAALRAQSIRIIAPIPGKATVGIEVPNGKRRIVRFSELIHKKAYDKKFAALPLFLGMDAEGEAIVEDLSKMPHLLIAGQTGAGKSVCINTIIASLLLTRSPHDVQMIMIDPKMVELQMYSDVPHQMCPVVTDMKQATRVLEWACEKMEGRYDLFKNANVRNIKGYNALGEKGLRERMGDDFNEERTPRHVPYIVLIIDEMADLMMVSKKEAEQAITRLAQKSRAVGIHVIVATQRPSTDVITGVLKGNLPTRIAFTVASKIDSRVILDAQGAEKLLGYGDMLYNPPQSSNLKRVQGALVEDHELEAVVEFVTKDSAPSFSQELIQAASGETRGDGGEMDFATRDDLWDQAVRVILKSRRGSASLLQRALGIGYTRASRLVDMMGEAGLVGEHKGSKSREVLLTLEDWEEMHGEELSSTAPDESAT